jgi:predicted phage terminase large subunit-like protein
VTSLAEIWDEITAAEIEETAAPITAPPMPLKAFVPGAWHVLEPDNPFTPTWHVDAIAEHLEWVARGDILRLLISIAPGTAKSILVGVLWPAWMWTWRPGWRSIFGSYDQTLSTRDAVKSRTVMMSPWYQETFRPSWRFTVDQNVKSYYRNDRMGERMAVSVGGAHTGFRGNCTVFDDPLNVKNKVHTDNDLDTAIHWWDVGMSSRLNNPAKDARVGIMQRLHERDLTGHLLAKQAGYVHLCLPSEFDPKRRSVTVIDGTERWRDPRKEPGELLFPARHSRTVLEEAKKDLGSWQFSAQHQQTPLPQSGGIFQRAWFKRYNSRKEVTPVWHEHLQSWDFAFKKKEDSDFVVGGVWSRFGSGCYRRYERRERMGYVESKQAMREVSASWPEAHAKLIENKANGPAIVEELRDSIPGIIPVENNDGVLAHAWAIQPFVEAGNIYIPEGPEGDAWLDEVCAYPKAAYDDRVAEFTQAILRLMKRAGEKPLARQEITYTEAGRVANQERF